MTNHNDRDQNPDESPRLPDSSAPSPESCPQPEPLDVVVPGNTLSYQESNFRQANMVLAQRLEAIDFNLAIALKFCADGHLACKRRVCLRCVRARSVRLGSRYRERLDRMASPHHLSLTSFPSEHLCKDNLQKLRTQFKLLRRRAQTEPEIKITGGVANIEVGLTNDGLRWLPHLHVVLDAPGAPSENWIRTAWVALGGGQQVRLDPIVPGTQVQTFQYGTKATVLPTSPTMLREFLETTRGLRPTILFGSLHPLSGKPPRRRPRPKPESLQKPKSPPAPEQPELPLFKTPRRRPKPKSPEKPQAPVPRVNPAKTVFYKDALAKNPVLRTEVEPPPQVPPEAPLDPRAYLPCGRCGHFPNWHGGARPCDAWAPNDDWKCDCAGWLEPVSGARP